MKGKPVSATAKKPAGGVGGVYVIATRDPQLPQKENACAELANYETASYVCKDCQVAFVANAGIQAHCLACGSSHTEVSAKKETASTSPMAKAKDADHAHYVCAGCGTTNVMPQTVVAACKDGVHCVACGEMNLFKTIATADADEGFDMNLEPEELRAESGDDLDDFDLVDTSDDSPEVATSDEDDLDGEVDDSETEESTAPPVVAADDAATDDTDDEDAEEAAPTDTGVEDLTGENPGAPGQADPPPSNAGVEYSEEDLMDVDMLDMNEDVPVSELSMVWLKDNLAIATADFKILATLSQEDAGTHSDIMETDAFAQAVIHDLATAGLRKTCENYGFKPVVASVPVKKLVAKRAEVAVAEKLAQLNAALASVHTDFEQSTEIAAAGYAKNFWKDSSDPLKAALVAELSSIGVRNPAKLVDRVWFQFAAKSMAAVLDKAKTLAQTSVTARNELVAVLDMSNGVMASDETEDGDEDIENEDDEEASLAGGPLLAGATPIKDKQVVTSGLQRVPGKSIVASILGGNKGHFNTTPY